MSLGFGTFALKLRTVNLRELTVFTFGRLHLFLLHAAPLRLYVQPYHTTVEASNHFVYHSGRAEKAKRGDRGFDLWMITEEAKVTPSVSTFGLEGPRSLSFFARFALETPARHDAA